MTHKSSAYMHWAKTCSHARFNLATSGVGHLPLAELEFDWSRLAIQGDNSYGYPPLKAAIAAKASVDASCVVTTEGTSMANYLAMATVLDPGDEVLIEQPAYGLLVDAALYIGAQVRRFPRHREQDFALDPAEVGRAITPRTRLIVVTNLHNPSGALTPEAVMRDVALLAREAGARLLVDEVYLDAVYTGPPRSAFHLGPQVITTSSLTKVYGLSGLRCGWILAEPALAEAINRLNDLLAATPVHAAELLSVAAFAQLDRIRERARKVVEADRALLTGFLSAQHLLSAPRMQFGTTCFARLATGDADAFVDRLRNQHETSAVPGRFFDMPEHMRIGMGVDHAMFTEGLRRLALALAGK